MSVSRKNLAYYLTVAAGLCFMLFFRFLPPLPGLSRSGMAVLGIFIGILLFWVRVGIDWPSLLLMAVLGTVPELKFTSVLSGAMGNETVNFLLLTFAMTYGLTKTCYIRRIAIAFLSCRAARRGGWQFAILYSVSILAIGMFVSPTVLFFVYLPIAEEIFAQLKLEKGSKPAALIMMLTVIMCGISSGMTPIAHAFPLLALAQYEKMYGQAISYAAYMAVCIPVGVVVSALTLGMFRVTLKPDLSMLKTFDPSRISGAEDKPTKRDRLVLAVFVLVVAMWVLPGLLLSFLSGGVLAAFLTGLKGLGTAFPPLIGVVLLCGLPVEGKPLLPFGEAFGKGVYWPGVIMCAGTTALGGALTNGDIGITTWLSETIAPVTSAVPVMVMVLIFMSWAAVQTNLSSNMVTATVVSTGALLVTTGMAGVCVPGLVVLIGMMSACAFATPPAMTAVAVAGSTGWTNPVQMMIYGFAAMVICILVFAFLGYPLSAVIL